MKVGGREVILWTLWMGNVNGWGVRIRAASCKTPRTTNTLRMGRHEEVKEVDQGLELFQRLKMCDDNEMKGKIDTAIQVLMDALRLYGPDAVVGSYNGGKDAVVIFHLLRACVAEYSRQKNIKVAPKVIYFDKEDEFDEVRDLVQNTCTKYNVDLITFNNMGFVEGLTRLITDAAGKPMAFVLGTREGDPNSGGQTYFTPSSDWMPPFMRVNPIIDWNYGTIWKFLLGYKLPYPSLYDRGYTSVGGKRDTLPNPFLLREDGSYNPAHMLSDWLVPLLFILR